MPTFDVPSSVWTNKYMIFIIGVRPVGLPSATKGVTNATVLLHRGIRSKGLTTCALYDRGPRNVTTAGRVVQGIICLSTPALPVTSLPPGNKPPVKTTSLTPAKRRKKRTLLGSVGHQGKKNKTVIYTMACMYGNQRLTDSLLAIIPCRPPLEQVEPSCSCRRILPPCAVRPRINSSSARAAIDTNQNTHTRASPSRHRLPASPCWYSTW